MINRLTVRCHLECETLEDRLALSAGTTVPIPLPSPISSPVNRPAVTLKNGVLSVVGTSGRDTIAVQSKAGRVVVAGQAFASTRVKRIVIAAGAGGDVVWVSNAVRQPCRILSGTGDDRVRGGGGNDVIVNQGGKDSIYVSPGKDVIYSTSLPNVVAPSPESLVNDILSLVNQERGKNGLKPLSLDDRLARAADLQAGNMAARSNTVGPDAAMQHTLSGVAQPTLVSRLNFVGYSYRSAAENIAFGFTSAADVVAAWLQSPGHRANILSPAFTNLGVGVQADAEGRLFFCQVFGAPR